MFYLLEEIWFKSVCRWFNHSKGWGCVNLGKLYVGMLLKIAIISAWIILNKDGYIYKTLDWKIN